MFFVSLPNEIKLLLFNIFFFGYNSLKSLIILFLQIVQDALDSAQKGRTSITIAHRLSTIKNVDQIYIIENGQIVEHGTHEELIKSQGIYHKLWNNSVH